MGELPYINVSTLNSFLGIFKKKKKKMVLFSEDHIVECFHSASLREARGDVYLKYVYLSFLASIYATKVADYQFSDLRKGQADHKSTSKKLFTQVPLFG